MLVALNNHCPLDEMEKHPEITKFVSLETIERAKIFASLLNKDISYKTLPRMSGVITFEWNNLNAEGTNVNSVTREHIDISEEGMNVHNKILITSGNIGTHEVKFSL